MQTIDVNDLVSTAFEACAEFGGPGDGSPVCAGCGWLDNEHRREPEIAEVVALPVRAGSAPRSKRLAS